LKDIETYHQPKKKRRSNKKKSKSIDKMRDGTKALLCVFLGFASGGCPTIGIVITQFLTYFNYRHNNFSFFPLRAESSSPTWEERAERNQPDPPLFFPLLVMMDEHIRHQ
jgi:hypothetical protein